MTRGEIDIALVKVLDRNSFVFVEAFLPKLEVSTKRVNKGDKVICVNYGLFNPDVFEEYPLFSKGFLSKIVKYGHLDLIYQLDCSIYRGASGGVVLNEDGKLIGITYQNIIINAEVDNKPVSLEFSNPSFAFSKDIVQEIIKHSNSLEKLRQLWVFSVDDDKMNKLITWEKMLSAKF